MPKKLSKESTVSSEPLLKAIHGGGEHKHWISVDPGGKSCGVALWHGSDLQGTRLFRSTVRDYEESAYEIAQDLDLLLTTWDPVAVLIEYPQFFGSAMGRAVAVKGDLVKLAWCCGVLAGAVLGHGIRPVMVGVQRWKGQAPKTVVEQQIRKALTSSVTKGFKKDIWDAVGIGLWVQGRLWQK